MIVYHPEHDIFYAVELVILLGLKWNAVLLANRVAIVSVDQGVLPQHQRIAAAFFQQAAF